MNWIELESPLELNWAEKPEWLRAGTVLKFEDGSVALVGDVNESGGAA